MYIYILRDFKETALRNIEKVVDGITQVIPCKGGVYYAVSIPEVEDEIPIRGQAFNEAYRIEDIVPKLRPILVQLSEVSDKAPSLRFIKILLTDSILTDIDKMSVDEIIIKHIKGKYRADVNAIIATAKRLLEEPYNRGCKELLGVVNSDAVGWVLKNPTIDDGIKEIIKKSL